MDCGAWRSQAPNVSGHRSYLHTDVQTELFSELLSVCPTMSSSSAVYQTVKYYSMFTPCPEMGHPQQQTGRCSWSLFANPLFGIRKHFPISTTLQMVVLHKCLVEPQCTWNAALAVLFPPPIIYSASLGKCILSSNLGCLKLTSLSAWQPLLWRFWSGLQLVLGKSGWVAFPRKGWVEGWRRCFLVIVNAGRLKKETIRVDQSLPKSSEGVTKGKDFFLSRDNFWAWSS